MGLVLKSSISAADEFTLVDKSSLIDLAYKGSHQVKINEGTKLRMKLPNCDVILKDYSIFNLTENTTVEVPADTKLFVSDMMVTKNDTSIMYLAMGKYSSNHLLGMVRNETPTTAK